MEPARKSHEDFRAGNKAAFEPRLKAVVGLSGPYNFGECWDDLPPLTRQTFVAKSGAADEEDGRARAARLDLTGAVERLKQPFLAITGRHDRLIPWEQTKRAADEVSNDHNTNLRDDLDKLTTLVRTTDRRNGRRVAQVNRRVDKLVDRLDLVEDTIDPRTLRRRTK